LGLAKWMLTFYQLQSRRVVLSEIIFSALTLYIKLNQLINTL